MHALTPSQFEAIASALAGIRAAYNAFKVEPCHFTGIPDDLSSLDYIPYELPIAAEYAAGSLAFSLAWGNVLATSFGFKWVSGNDCAAPKEFALRHEKPSVLIFPYFRLLELTHSSVRQECPAETLWFDTIRYFDRCSYVPNGWHPVFDAASCPDKLKCPTSTTKACLRLVEEVPEFYEQMSTYPYAFARNRQWRELTDYAEQIATNYQLTNR